MYEFLLRYVVSNDTDAKTAKKYIDQFFVVRACLLRPTHPSRTTKRHPQRIGAEVLHALHGLH